MNSLFMLVQESISFSQLATSSRTHAPLEQSVVAHKAAGTDSAQDVTPSNTLEASQLVKDALAEALRKPQISARHLEAALRVTRPSVSKADRSLYERLRDKLLSIRSNISVSAATVATVGMGTPGSESLLDGLAVAGGPGAAVPKQGDANNIPGDDAMRGVA